MKRLATAVCLMWLTACSTVATKPTAPEDTARQAIAATKLALVGAYNTTSDLVARHVISTDAGRDIFIRLSQAESLLTNAQVNVIANPTAAQTYINLAVDVVNQVVAELQRYAEQHAAAMRPDHPVQLCLACGR